MNDLVINNLEAFEASLKTIDTKLEELQSDHTKTSIRIMAMYKAFIKANIEDYFEKAEEVLPNIKKNHPVDDTKYLLTLLNSSIQTPIKTITGVDSKASDVHFMFAGKEFTETFKDLTIGFIVSDITRDVGYYQSLNNRINSGISLADGLLRDLRTAYMDERNKYSLIDGISITLKDNAHIASKLSNCVREVERKLEILGKYLEENSMTATIAGADKEELVK